MILPLAAISLGVFGLLVRNEWRRRVRKKETASTYDVYPPQARGYAPVPPDSYTAAGTANCGAISVGHDWWEGPARNVFEGAYLEGITDTDELVSVVVERALAPCYPFLERPSPGLNMLLFDLRNAVEAWKEERGSALALLPAAGFEEA